MNFLRLYDETFVTVQEACLAFIMFVNKYNLSKAAQKNLLSLVHLLIPIKNEMPKTVKKVFKFMTNDSDEINENTYCDDCFCKLNFENKCQNDDCKNHNALVSNKNKFSFINLEPKIKSLIQNYSNEISKFQNSKRDFLDIVDGEHYKSLKQDNYLSLIVYTDGIQISKSNGKCFFPVIVGLCELPLIIRDSIKNKIVYGVWFGTKKPKSDILFENLSDDLNKINQNGFDLMVLKLILN